jgi:acyl-CoA synthetase (AMP-forming)/AMP-acid ligase II
MAGDDWFAAALNRNAAANPAKTAVRFCRADGDAFSEETLSYQEVDRAARATAAWLQSNLELGARALLLYPQGLGFVTGFVGCLYAGITPVAAPLPTGYSSQAERAAKIARDARTSIVLTDEQDLPDIRGWLDDSGLAGTMPVVAGPAATADPAGWRRPSVQPAQPAFLQYTSGSTSTPRGVLVSHGNLVHNLHWLRDALGWDSEDTLCSWLPMYHDMGLILMLLCPLYLGSTVTLMAPNDFLRRPQLWLRLVDTFGATASAAPNFAYELCVRRVTDAQIDGLDLSRWRYAINGAEPIDAVTLARFAERFARAGLRAEALSPGYGLAEATLGVSATPAGRGPRIWEVDAQALERNQIRPAEAGRPTRTLVSSGRFGVHDVRVVDPDNREVLPEGRIGEIWIGSGSVPLGYWRQPAETERTFRAVTAAGEGPFLRTGDLGLISDGELFVTGRIKEILIIHGRNLYPHDIERAVRAADPAFADRLCCAFSARVPHEEIVVVQELRAAGLDRARMAELAGRIRRVLFERLNTRVANVVFVKVGQVLRTTSGKIQRAAMSEMFRKGELNVVYEDLDPATRARYRR